MFRLAVRNAWVLALLLVGLTSVCVAQPQQKDEKSARAAAEGKEWFRTYCASCHGEGAKGNGPVARALKQQPPDLTTLSKRDNGKFPADYVRKVLVHGASAPAHGTADMPVWGPTFASINSSELIRYELKEDEVAMKILLAVDGSKYSDTTIQTLISKMRKEEAEVLVLQVVEPRIFSTPPEMAAGYEPELAELMKEQLKQAQQTVDRAASTLKAAGFNAKGRIVEAEARTGILDTASEWHADLIVLGSHGRKGLQRFMLGSVAESVARGAYCSVLIVRAA